MNKKQLAIIGITIVSIAILALSFWRPTQSNSLFGKDLVSVSVQKVIAAFQNRDFDTVDQTVNAILQQSQITNGRYQPFGNLLRDLTPRNDPAHLKNLNDWLTAKPDSIAALLLRGDYFFKHAWFSRGDKFEVTTENRDTFRSDMINGLNDFTRVTELNPDIPYAYMRMVQITPHVTKPNTPGETRGEGIFQKAIAKYPDYLDLYTPRVSQLAGKWYGSRQMQQDFTEKYATGALPQSLLKFLYTEFYQEQLNDDKLFFHGSDAEWQTHLKQYTTSPGVVARIQSMLDLSKTMAPYDFNEMFIYSADGLNDMYWSYMFTDAFYQQAQRTLGDHNYAVNYLLGGYYFKKACRANPFDKTLMQQAIAYYLKAAADAEAFTFPSEATRNYRVGNAYAGAGLGYSQLQDYPNLITYGTKAVALYPNQKLLNANICAGYLYTDHPQKALPYCDYALQIPPFKNVDDAYAHRIRSEVYTKIKPELAAAELLAASPNPDGSVDTKEVIRLGMNLVKQENPKEVVALFTANPQIFDASKDKLDATNAYGILCGAYIQLSDYKAAMTACEQSLAITETPEARTMQKSLIGRVK